MTIGSQKLDVDYSLSLTDEQIVEQRDASTGIVAIPTSGRQIFPTLDSLKMCAVVARINVLDRHDRGIAKAILFARSTWNFIRPTTAINTRFALQHGTPIGFKWTETHEANLA